MKKTMLPALLLLAVAGCGGGGSGLGPSAVMTAEEYCALVPNPLGWGNMFYCGSSQANLQVVSFPNGARGYCMSADQNLGLVGYSATTYNGGASPVMSQSRASDMAWALGNQSPGYTRCTRI